MKPSKIYDVLVIGGGHAGIEAANIASKMGSQTCLISIPGVPLGSAPCNPAIGGVGKGQLVKEIDALGGLMGKLADQAGIQYRTLNESKGFAVASTRVQIDKEIYSQRAEEIIQKLPRLDIFRSKVATIQRTNENIFEVQCVNRDVFQSKTIIVTAGTFLNGLLHSGADEKVGGRVGCESSTGLGDLLKEVTFRPQRFKTGTPARLSAQSIDFSVMEKQPSCESTFNFSHLTAHGERRLEQVPCHITYTTSQTIEIIRKNRELSPIFNGQISGVGPRYCPSIEDKAFRYPDRFKHHIFVEPEGLDSNSIYPNGISTSLPKEIQLEFIKTIPGFENAEILVPGYAVEYDVVDSTELDGDLQHRELKGVYFAGQVNGTSGYEEAAGQGIVAGINASRAADGLSPLIFSRDDSYLGVLIGDLVGSLRDEPYRLFTARSENRLYLREDNALFRMWSYRTSVLPNDPETLALEEIVVEKKFISDLFAKNSYLKDIQLQLKRDPRTCITKLKSIFEEQGFEIHPIVLRSIAIDSIYEGYISRAEDELRKVNLMDRQHIEWEKICDSTNVSYECRSRIQRVRPKTFGELKRIEGIRPATLVVVASGYL